MSEVRLLSSWDGYCGPCDEVRPLALTERGVFGLRARRAGTPERVLTLTCRICGQWQLVPRDERQDPEVVLPAEDAVELPSFVKAAQQAPVWHEPELEEPAALEVEQVEQEPVDEVTEPELEPEPVPEAPVHAAPVFTPPVQEPAFAAAPLETVALAALEIPEQAPAPVFAAPTFPAPAPAVPLAVAEEPRAAFLPVAERYEPVPVPRVQAASLPADADLSTVLELLSQGLELAGPGASDRA